MIKMLWKLIVVLFAELLILTETQVVISFKKIVQEICSRIQENNSIVLSEVSQ